MTFFFIEKNRHQIKFIFTILPWHISNLSIHCTCLSQALSLSQCPVLNQKPITCLIRSQVAVKRVVSRKKILQISFFGQILTTKIINVSWIREQNNLFKLSFHEYIFFHSMSTFFHSMSTFIPFSWFSSFFSVCGNPGREASKSEKLTKHSEMLQMLALKVFTLKEAEK